MRLGLWASEAYIQMQLIPQYQSSGCFPWPISRAADANYPHEIQPKCRHKSGDRILSYWHYGLDNIFSIIKQGLVLN